uniref:Secreted protein n=1 Tax=Macrostomum lignano TaxID=282301 RepID=A0A1I8F1I2_9PLAT
MTSATAALVMTSGLLLVGLVLKAVEAGHHEKRLLRDLFDNKNESLRHNPMERPVQNDSAVLPIGSTRGFSTRGFSTRDFSTRARSTGGASTGGASTGGARTGGANTGAPAPGAPAPGGRQHRGRQHRAGQHRGSQHRGASTGGASTGSQPRDASSTTRQHQYLKNCSRITAKPSASSRADMTSCF